MGGKHFDKLKRLLSNKRSRLATFRVLTTYAWLLAAKLDSTGLDAEG